MRQHLSKLTTCFIVLLAAGCQNADKSSSPDGSQGERNGEVISPTSTNDQKSSKDSNQKDADGWITYESKQFGYVAKLPAKPRIRDDGQIVSSGKPLTSFYVEMRCKPTEYQSVENFNTGSQKKTEVSGFAGLFQESKQGETQFYDLKVIANGHFFNAVMVCPPGYAKYSKKFFDSIKIDKTTQGEKTSPAAKTSE